VHWIPGARQENGLIYDMHKRHHAQRQHIILSVSLSTFCDSITVSDKCLNLARRTALPTAHPLVHFIAVDMVLPMSARLPVPMLKTKGP
jgi:hypothetical protein